MESLIGHIDLSKSTGIWTNGKCGKIIIDDKYYIYYFEDEAKNRHLVAIGFVAFWLKHHRGQLNENMFGLEVEKIEYKTLEMYNRYFDLCLQGYKDEHEDDADAFKRDLEKEFKKVHYPEEKKKVRESNALFDYITQEDAQKIQNFAQNYLEFAKGKCAYKMTKKDEQREEVIGIIESVADKMIEMGYMVREENGEQLYKWIGGDDHYFELFIGALFCEDYVGEYETWEKGRDFSQGYLKRLEELFALNGVGHYRTTRIGNTIPKDYSDIMNVCKPKVITKFR